jgi:hypothetical protein
MLIAANGFQSMNSQILAAAKASDKFATPI